ncbi:hypothetical protein J437_LFUL016614 [Ladona fulva]|uniref:AAA+ ATPase domain-containing protein n=1 Tax=Ladona fulva TaxID=123851 RepID=A0A8K0P7D6_LADFU|nr:hypothetical protein J437_LFUL016614 [Ladona fulva]
MTLAWKHPFTCICAGPSGCGKTTFVTKFLENLEHMIDHDIGEIVWCCSPGSEPNINSSRVQFQCEIPSIEDSSGSPAIYVIDDLMIDGGQVYPENSRELERVYKESTKEPFGYLVLDLGQDTDDRFHFRTKIFPEDETTTVFMHVNDEKIEEQ